MTYNTSPHLVETVKALAREGVPAEEAESVPARSDPRWRALRELGTRLWLDTGDMAGASRHWTEEFDALTTNNTLLNREVQKGIYDEFIARTVSSSSVFADLDREQKIIELALILNARHGLKLAHRFDAFVSVELHTDLAHDLQATVWYARRLHDIYPERFIVKVPLTAAGYLAARKLGAEGIEVNFTLGFSARQNVLAARLAEPTFLNVFLGRLNSVVDDNDLGVGDNVGERTLVASQEAVAGLRAERGLKTQQIAASMRAAEQIGALAGVDVMTLPLSAAEGFLKEEMTPNDLVPFQNQRYPVELRPGPSQAVVNALWEVTPRFNDTVDALLDEPLDGYEACDLRGFFAQRSLSDLFPAWTEDDVKTISRDGKIPSYSQWADRLHEGDVGLDALMSMSGLRSFAADQEALDARIEEHLS